MSSNKSQFQEWLEAVAIEMQENAEVAYRKVVTARNASTQPTNLKRLQSDAAYWAREARMALWDALGYERYKAP
jgi:hypothetical protein